MSSDRVSSERGVALHWGPFWEAKKYLRMSRRTAYQRNPDAEQPMPSEMSVPQSTQSLRCSETL